MRLRNDPTVNELLRENKQWLINIDIEDEELLDFHKIFNSNNKVHLEIGMGKGDFLIGNALKYPQINFVGIEMALPVVGVAIRKLNKLETIPTNLKLITMDANLVLLKIPFKSIDQIFLNFSDPWPKLRHTKRRLTFDTNLVIYHKLLTDKGLLQMKTDNDNLYNYSLQNFKKHDWSVKFETTDLYKEKLYLENNIPTEYENKFSKLKNINMFIVGK